MLSIIISSLLCLGTTVHFRLIDSPSSDLEFGTPVVPPATATAARAVVVYVLPALLHYWCLHFDDSTHDGAMMNCAPPVFSHTTTTVVPFRSVPLTVMCLLID